MCDISSLKQALEEGIVRVTFVKADGTQRVMMATQFVDHLPNQQSVELSQKSIKESQTKSTDPNLIKVYDLEVQGWRSFRAERVLSWQKIQS